MPGDDELRRRDAREEVPRPRELAAPGPLGEVAAHRHERGRQRGEIGDERLHRARVLAAEVQVGKMGDVLMAPRGEPIASSGDGRSPPVWRTTTRMPPLACAGSQGAHRRPAAPDGGDRGPQGRRAAGALPSPGEFRKGAGEVGRRDGAPRVRGARRGGGARPRAASIVGRRADRGTASPADAVASTFTGVRVGAAHARRRRRSSRWRPSARARGGPRRWSPSPGSRAGSGRSSSRCSPAASGRPSRTRSPRSPRHAFPSGHAMGAVVVWGLLGVVAARRWPRHRPVLLAAAAALALGGGASRVYLGVHFPTDVLGGWAGGAAILAARRGGAAAEAGPLPPGRKVRRLGAVPPSLATTRRVMILESIARSPPPGGSDDRRCSSPPPSDRPRRGARRRRDGRDHRGPPRERGDARPAPRHRPEGRDAGGDGGGAHPRRSRGPRPDRRRRARRRSRG